MKKVVFGLIFCFGSLLGFSQSKVLDVENLEVFYNCENMPLYDGAKNHNKSTERMNNFISNRSKGSLVEDKGRVFIRFIIDTEGSLRNATVIKGVSFEADESALSIINDLKPWIAGTQRERKVLVQYTVMVEFK